MYVHTHSRMHIHMHVHICTHTCTHVHTFTHLSNLFLFLSSMTTPTSATCTGVRRVLTGAESTETDVTLVSLLMDAPRSRFAFSAARRSFLRNTARICWCSSSSSRSTKVDGLGAWRIRCTTRGDREGQEGGVGQEERKEGGADMYVRTYIPISS